MSAWPRNMGDDWKNAVPVLIPVNSLVIEGERRGPEVTRTNRLAGTVSEQ